MVQYTLIWEERWQSGSHSHCLTKKSWVQADSIHDIMKSEYGPRTVFIFEGFVTTLGEEFDPSLVFTINK
jgi:hypothetical protein